MKIRYNKILIAVLLIATISFLSFRLSHANLQAFGDVTDDGITNSLDSYYIDAYIAELIDYTPLGITYQYLNGDITGDDKVDVTDAAIIRFFDFCFLGISTFTNMPDSINIVSGDGESGVNGSAIPLTVEVLNANEGLVGNAYITFKIKSGSASFSSNSRITKKERITTSGLNSLGGSRVSGFGMATQTLYLRSTPGEQVQVEVSCPGIHCSSRGYGWSCSYCDSVPGLTPVDFTVTNYGVEITDPPGGSFFRRTYDTVTFVAETIPGGEESSITWSGDLGNNPSTTSGQTFTTQYYDTGTKTVTATLTIGDNSVSASRSVKIIDVIFSPSTLYLRRNQAKRVDVTVDPSEYQSSVYFESSDTNIATIIDGSAPSIRISGVGLGSTTIKAYIDDVYLAELPVVVVDLDMSARDLDGVVSEGNELVPGAYVYFNVDNDDGSDNTQGAPPKYPGGDHLEIGPIIGEDDLKQAEIVMDYVPNTGKIILKRSNTNLRVWSSQAKGADKQILVATNEKIWDLSVTGQPAEFNNVKNNLWVEGYESGSANLTVEYQNPSNNIIDYDTVKYTFIAAICGDQPKTEGPPEAPPHHIDPNTGKVYTQREAFEGVGGAFPLLVRSEWSITDNRVISYEDPGAYNCIAWSVGITNNFYFPEHIDMQFGDKNGIYNEYDEPFEDANGNGVYDKGETFTDIDESKKYSWSDIDDFYEVAGLYPIATGVVDAEVIYYPWGEYWDYRHKQPKPIVPGFHAARRKQVCSCGAGRWIMYESKCGDWERIEHVWNQLNDSDYGTPGKFYK